MAGSRDLRMLMVTAALFLMVLILWASPPSPIPPPPPVATATVAPSSAAAAAAAAAATAVSPHVASLSSPLSVEAEVKKWREDVAAKLEGGGVAGISSEKLMGRLAHLAEFDDFAEEPPSFNALAFSGKAVEIGGGGGGGSGSGGPSKALQRMARAKEKANMERAPKPFRTAATKGGALPMGFGAANGAADAAVAASPLPTPGLRRQRRGVAFLKTYKTGSTTVAMYMSACAYQLRLRALHPLDKGWFAPRELEARAKAFGSSAGSSATGASSGLFDVSFRHLTPHADYASLGRLLGGPAAPPLFVSILREPVSRFVSLFNFVGTIRVKYRSAEAFVAAVKGRDPALTLGDANSFCNNMAWVVSGRPLEQSYAWVDLEQGGQEAASKEAKELIQTLEGRGVVMLMSHRMSESLVLLSNLAGWDLGALQFRDMTERVQASKKYKCEKGETACAQAIKSCNGVDTALYEHYLGRFNQIIRQIPDLDRQLNAFNKKWSSRAGGAWTKKYPVNCRKKIQSPATRQFDEVHAC